MAGYTEGATGTDVKIHVLKALETGDWKGAGEIKDYVERNASLSPAAKKPLANRPAEAQVRNSVQNVLRPGTKSSLVGQGLVEYDAFRGYRITPDGKRGLADMKYQDAVLSDLFKDEC